MLRSLNAAFLAFSFTSALLAAQANSQRVLLATSPDGAAHAYFSPDIGLWLAGFHGKARTVIGHGSEPRFDAAGRLWFTRAFDDGHYVTRQITMLFEPGARAPRATNAPAPAYRLPRPMQPLDASVKVVVDAGHGGTDPGALGNGLREADVNLAVAKRLQAWLDLDTADTRGGGAWNVLMTRTTDTFISLDARTNAANAFGAASFLSVHMNAFSSSSANGSETYCYTGTETRPAGLYRNRIQNEVLAAWGLTNRGVKTAGFYVLRYTSMPAVLLEGGFITNATDASRMKDAARIDRLALGLLWATQEHHGIQRYTPSSGGGNKPGTLTGVVYDITQGTGSRVVDATVVLSNGVLVRSAPTTGLWSFSLAAGTYKYVASAPGYLPLELTRTVTSEQTVWGSVGLQPTTAPTLDCPDSVIGGATLSIRVGADASSPVLLVLGASPSLLPLGSFGIVIPDLQGALTFNAGVTSSSGVLNLGLATTATLRGARLLVQPFALRGQAWKLGNAAGFRID